MDMIDKLLSRIKVTPDGCFEWQGSRHKPQSFKTTGYGRVKCPATKKMMQAHRASFIAFRRAIPDGVHVCHRCDNPCCINPAHLFLGTNFDNMRDASDKDRMAFGETHYRTKLRDSDVTEIRNLCAAGKKQAEIGAIYGICRGNVCEISSRRTWKHVP